MLEPVVTQQSLLCFECLGRVLDALDDSPRWCGVDNQLPIAARHLGVYELGDLLLRACLLLELAVVVLDLLW